MKRILMACNPGPGMVKFGAKTISEKDAKAIAAYILKTFQ